MISTKFVIFSVTIIGGIILLLFLWKHIRRTYLFLKYTLRVIDESAKNASMKNMKRWIYVYGHRWYSRKMVYTWVKLNRDGLLKYVPDEDRIKAKHMWENDTPIKEVRNNFIGVYLTIFRDEYPEIKYPWHITFSYTYKQMGRVVKVISVNSKYKTINGGINIAQCRFATEKEIDDLELAIYEKEAIDRCKRYNIIPVHLERKDHA